MGFIKYTVSLILLERLNEFELSGGGIQIHAKYI